jgi:acylphosphatase
VTRRFRVEGKVQGVFFRNSARRVAQARAIAGYARNLPDGSVEVLAHGTAEAIAELKAWLLRGPPAAHVERVHELEHLGGPPPATDFDIL